MRYLIIVLLLCCTSVVFAQDKLIQKPQVRSSDNQYFYAGYKLGFPFFGGVDLGYIAGNENRQVGYVNLSGQTIGIYHSINLGAGMFLGNSNFTLGARYNVIIAPPFLDEDVEEDTIRKIFLPEIAWFKKGGARKRGLYSVQLGSTGLNFSVGYIF